MSTNPAVRAAKFGHFITRVLQEARGRGMTVPEIERATGVSKSTFYRWRDGEWTKDPRPSQVKAFCEGLGVPYEAAYRVLGWSEMGVPAEPTEPMDLDPDVREVARRLRDPNVPESEKIEIRAMMRYLARRRDDDQRRAAG